MSAIIFFISMCKYKRNFCGNCLEIIAKTKKIGVMSASNGSFGFKQGYFYI